MLVLSKWMRYLKYLVILTVVSVDGQMTVGQNLPGVEIKEELLQLTPARRGTTPLKVKS